MDDPQVIDFKFVESYLRDKFLRPFARRLKYMYLGFDRCEDMFILSDTEDIDFKYCEALQTTGIIKIKNAEDLQKLLLWFNHFKIDRTKPCIFYFGDLITLLNKMKWDDPNIRIESDSSGIVTMSTPEHKDIVISRPIDTYFTLTRLQGFVDKYTAVFFENDGIFYDIMPDEKKNNASLIQLVSCAPLYEAGLLDVPCEDLKLVLLYGLDLLVEKSLIGHKNDYKFGIRLWADNGQKCLNYGSFYIDDAVGICTCRDNIFIFPIAKKEQPIDDPRPST